MATLTLFVVTHSADLFEKIPHYDFIRPILLGDLDIPARFRGESLSENRLFLSSEALDVATDFVGVVSSRLEEREPGRPNFDGFEALVSQMDEHSFWSPKFRPLKSRRQIQYWITAQDGIHPGMSSVLSFVQGRLYEDPILTNGVAANGNQFVVERNQWFHFIEMWTRGLLIAEENFGIDLPYDYRCWKCHRRHPNGYGRYTKERHLGFFGERMTALHFAHQGLTSSTYGGRALEETMPLSWAPDILLPLAAKAVEPYWRLTGAIAGRCDVCQESNEFPKP